MSTITLKDNIVVSNKKENTKKENTLKSKIVNYLAENQAIIISGLYAASGRIPDAETLRSLNMR